MPHVMAIHQRTGWSAGVYATATIKTLLSTPRKNSYRRSSKTRCLVGDNRYARSSVLNPKYMITYQKMDETVLQEFARKINILIEGINTLTESEKEEKVEEMRRYINLSY
jgi:hypothetical protein